MRPRALGLLTLVAALSGCGGAPDRTTPDPQRASARLQVQGQAISTTGEPISGARVSADGRHAVTGTDGRFTLNVTSPEWVTVSRRGFLRRTRPGFPGVPLLVRLTPDDGRVVSVTFGGDVMFGRRFYERGTLAEPLLSPNASVADHERLLEDVKPLLQEPDLAVVNLETPLIERPYYATGRPGRFHQTKEFAFASAPESATALRNVGVDVVGLGNNHLYDVLQPGIKTTLTALQRAGYKAGSGHFGAGRSRREAWRAATVKVKGQKISMLGCTSIEGYEHPVPYVAMARQGGAAACDERQITAAVRRLRAAGHAVVMMVHGGYEYARRPSVRVRRYSTAARRAGATLVMTITPTSSAAFAGTVVL